MAGGHGGSEMLTKRDLIATAAAGALAAPFIARPGLSAEADVVVVGAGAAGIAAGHALRAAGRSAVILEARRRVGGRAYTDTSLGAPYDAGAMFIHWSDRNPWVPIAASLGIPTPDEGWGGGFRVFANGRPMDEAERLKRRGAFGRMEPRLEAMSPTEPDRSIADLLGDLGPDLAPIAASGLLLSIGENAERISARDYRRLWAGSDRIVPSGYGNLVARHGEGLDIRLGTPVTAIDWSGRGVAVETAGGTLRARACILTVPVGVLKAGAIRFTPQLPARTRDALAGIGMGALTKIALAVGSERFGIAPGMSYLEAGVPGRLMNFDLFPDGHGIVVGYCGGDHARELSALPLADAREHVTDLLARMIGPEFRRAVSGVSFPAWWTDPFAQGSYSICLPGHADARDVLAEPIGGNLLIAGEATAGGGAMTVGGATLAGRAAVAAMLRLKG